MSNLEHLIENAISSVESGQDMEKDGSGNMAI